MNSCWLLYILFSVNMYCSHARRPGFVLYLTDLAYSVGVMPNFSLNCLEK